jgi:DNA polymerase-1
MKVLTDSLKLALMRGAYMEDCARMEIAGIPLDVPALRSLQRNWDCIRRKLVGQSWKEYPFFDGLHFNNEKFDRWVVKEGLGETWPCTKNSKIRKSDSDTFSKQVDLRPELEPARVLIKTVRMKALNVACDEDGRSRVLLGAFGTITSRNAPNGGEQKGNFLLGLPKWTRFLIRPQRGRALAYLDWVSQEYAICGVLSGDRNMLACYGAGDVYVQFAILAGAVPREATRQSHPIERKLYKRVALALGYGMRWFGLMKALQISETAAKRLCGDYERVFSAYCDWKEGQLDNFFRTGRITTTLGWPLHRSGYTKPNTVFNFPIQGNAAEMLRIAIAETHLRGVSICAPLHDALLIEAPIWKIERAVQLTREAMAIASKTILSGFELRVDCQDDKIVKGRLVRGDITRFPQRFYSEDGAEFWNRIQKLQNGGKHGRAL